MLQLQKSNFLFQKSAYSVALKYCYELYMLRRGERLHYFNGLIDIESIVSIDRPPDLHRGRARGNWEILHATASSEPRSAYQLHFSLPDTWLDFSAAQNKLSTSWAWPTLKQPRRYFSAVGFASREFKHVFPHWSDRSGRA